jgi:voltage-gated sodium channel
MGKQQSLRTLLNNFVEHQVFQRSIMALIIINAIILGLETSPEVMAAFAPQFNIFDQFVIVVFCVELVLRIYAKGTRFFFDPWGIFDLIVVVITLLPSSEALSVLRALRVLRVFRLVSAIPRLRRIVAALLHAVPGVGAVMALLMLVFYVFSVITTKVFGENFPNWFGSLGESMFTLFQIMTLESWSMGIVRPVMEMHPWAWILFLTFIILSSFTVLNLFIAIIIDSMQSLNNDNRASDIEGTSEVATMAANNDHEELKKIREEIQELRRLLVNKPN